MTPATITITAIAPDLPAVRAMRCPFLDPTDVVSLARSASRPAHPWRMSGPVGSSRARRGARRAHDPRGQVGGEGRAHRGSRRDGPVDGALDLRLVLGPLEPADQLQPGQGGEQVRREG